MNYIKILIILAFFTFNFENTAYSQSLTEHNLRKPLDCYSEYGRESSAIRYFNSADIPDVIFDVLKDSNVKEAIAYALASGYKCESSFIIEVFDLIQADPDSVQTIRAIRDKLFNYNNRSIKQRYDRYCATNKARIVVDLIKEDIKAGVIVDVGCGDLRLAHEIAGSMPDATNIIGTDVINYTEKTNGDPRVEFRLQRPEDGYQIPVETGSVDIVLLNWVLHHVSPENITGLLSEIKRILKKDGKVIILEDSYSERQAPFYESGRLFRKFHSLSAAGKRNYMTFIDWWATRVMRDLPEMNRPFNFHSGEEWVSIFEETGFRNTRLSYLGYPPDKIHKNPQCFLVFENRQKSVDLPIKTGPLSQVSDGAYKRDVVFEGIDRFAKGRAIFLKPDMMRVEQTFIPEAVAYDFSKFNTASQSPEVKTGKRTFKRFPGKTLKEALQGYGFKDRVIFASNSLQTNFWGANGFLIVEGKLIVKPKGSLGLFQEEGMSLNGKFWVFSFDEKNNGVKEINIENGTPDYIERRINNGISGLPLVSGGKNISYLIEKGKPSLTGAQSDWDDPQNQKAAMSAVGKDSNGDIVFIHMAGDPDKQEEITFYELAEMMIHLGVVEAIALGTSADVNQYVKNDKEPYLNGNPRRGSMSAIDYPNGRPLGAFIFIRPDNDKISLRDAEVSL